MSHHQPRIPTKIAFACLVAPIQTPGGSAFGKKLRMRTTTSVLLHVHTKEDGQARKDQFMQTQLPSSMLASPIRRIVPSTVEDNRRLVPAPLSGPRSPPKWSERGALRIRHGTRPLRLTSAAVAFSTVGCGGACRKTDGHSCNATRGRMERGNVICQLQSRDGVDLGPKLDLPFDVTPTQLQALVNDMLQSEEPLPYAFYLDGKEVVGELGQFLHDTGRSVEETLKIVYQPQAIFRVRPVTRCSSSMKGHSEAVLSVQFSPNGKELASGSGDKTVRFWDLNMQLPKHEGIGHTGWVLCVAWSPDAQWVASGSMDCCIRLWDPKTGNTAGLPMKGHAKWVSVIAWEPAHLCLPSRRFVSGSKDGRLKIWDAVTRRCTVSLSGHQMAVTCLKWGGDGLIYSSSRDCQISIWDSEDGKLVRQLRGHGHWVNTMALSTEYALRTGAFDHTGTCPKAVEASKEKALERYNSARDGKPERLVSGSDDFTLLLWVPMVEKRPTARMTGHMQLVNQVQFSPDGRWIISASFDKSVKLWDGMNGTFITTLVGHVGPVYQVAWSADSRLFVSASKDSTLKVWELRSRKLMEDLPGHADEVFSVDWSPDGKKVASGGKDRIVKVWHN